MTQTQARSHARMVYGSLAGLTAMLLAAAFISPFYGALDGPVPVVETGNGGSVAVSGGSGNGIVVEQFDYDEPDTNGAETPTQQDAPAAPTVDANGLQREAPRPPLSDLGLASTPKPPEPVAPPAPATPVAESEAMQLLQRPVAIAAGRLESQGRIVDLQDIEIMPVDAMCQTATGESWPCGMQARTAFRQWLRSRAVMCRLPQDDSGGAIATECKLGSENAAEWLVENGWAKAVANGPYAEAGRKAEEARQGIFGDKTDVSLPDFSPDAQSLPPPALEPQPSAPLSPPTQSGEFPPVPPAQ